jgi:UDP-N-acetylglucosamine/UDP-N-acetylgalactosamine diphosphorylase
MKKAETDVLDPQPKAPPMELGDSFRRAEQDHVLRFFSELNNDARAAFLKQLKTIDLEQVRELAAARSVAEAPEAPERAPASVVELGKEPDGTTRAQAVARGKELLGTGKVGAFLVAGGQGTRLGFSGPKGCFPVGPLSGKTLFQLHAEKIRALGAEGGNPLTWYIMTSEANDAETRAFFESNQFFGLSPENVLFFQQAMNPALDDDGKLVLEAKGRVFMSPNGHGGSYAAFAASGALEDAERRGIEHLFYFQVDNPLIRIADPLFMGLHDLTGSEMSLKVLRRAGPDEKVGVVALEDGDPKVIEYSDFSAEESARADASGDLVYWAASIGIHAFRISFFKRVANGSVSLPYHVASKKIPALDKDGKAVQIDGRKFERFVFDALPFAKNPLNLEVVRAQEFGPVKNKEGVDSVDTARELLVEEYRRWLAAAGIQATGRIEISPLVAVDAEQLKSRLAGFEADWNSDFVLELAVDGSVEARTAG